MLVYDSGKSGLSADPGQVGIQVKIEAGRPAFDTAQQQVLHGVKADGTQPEGVLHGVVDFLMGEVLQQAQGAAVSQLDGGGSSST